MMRDLAGFSLEAQIDCVEREIGMRRSVYKRRVDEGKMSSGRANAEINCMLAVLETLKGLRNGYVLGWDTVSAHPEPRQPGEDDVSG
jgi:hypothetical protein